MFFQPFKSGFIIDIIKEVEKHEAISHWTLMENSEVNNKHKIKIGNSRMFYPFGLSRARYSKIEY